MVSCSICGEKTFYMMGEAVLSGRPEHHEYHLCANCFAAVRSVEKDASNDSAHVRYLRDHLPNIEDANVRKYIGTLLGDIIEAKPEGTNERYEKFLQVSSKMLLTSGFNFEGYTIDRYLGFASSEAVLGMGFFRAIAAGLSNVFGIESDSLRSKLEDAKEAAMNDLKLKAFHAGANAIIGVDLDYTMFGDSMVAVVVSGTLVMIREIDLLLNH